MTNNPPQKTCRFCHAPISQKMEYGASVVCETCGSIDTPEPKARPWLKYGFIAALLLMVVCNLFYFKTAILLRISPSYALSTMSEDQLVELNKKCSRANDPKCRTETFRKLSETNPSNVIYAANFAFGLTTAKKFAEADPIYKKLLASGTGTYDLMGYYGANLDGLGQYGEAIKWYEKALEIDPRLVDILHALSADYIRLQRPFEAVSLLKSAIRGFPHLEKVLAGDLSADMEVLKASSPSKNKIRFVSVEANGLQHIPITMKKDESPKMFLVDKSADSVVIPTEDAEALYPTLMAQAKSIQGKLTNGRAVTAKEMIVPSMQVGPWTMNNVDVIYCDHCDRSAGMSLLKSVHVESRTEGNFHSMVLSR